MTDRAFCFSLVLAELIVSDVMISPDDSEGVVLAKVMESAKEIRPDYKKREGAPPRLDAGRLCGLLADAGLSGCRRCKEEEPPPPGVVGLAVAVRGPW